MEKYFVVDGVEFFLNGDFADFTDDEARHYIDFVNSKDFNHDDFTLAEISLTECEDGKVDLIYTLHATTHFERIRRITGYLTGDLTSWNNAKRSEERDRVKHNTKWFNTSGRARLE